MKIRELFPTSIFAGHKRNKLGPAAHLTGKMKRPAKPGDLVGGSESIELESCKYGRYFCSTDKKWKCRQSPKQSRKS